MKKETYTILRTETKNEPYYEVVRPGGHVVNATRFKTRREAEKKLVLLEAMGYCKRGD